MKKNNRRRSAHTINPRRQRLFGVLASLIPVLFILILEFALRWFHYGPDLSIFSSETLEGKSYYTLNPSCKNRYFSRSGFIPDPSPEHFLVNKPAGTLRIFCLGGSTTVGFPYWYNGAFASFLRDRLKAIIPDRPVELINLGMTATNSYTVLDIARELIRYQPDLFIVYDGHNEFYGALGIASHARTAPTRWLTLVYLRAVHLRTFQLVKDALFGLRSLWSRSPVDQADHTTLMEQVASGKNVPYRSPLYLKAYNAFQSNLTDLAVLCRQHHIPLILSTQASDLRDQAPFISNHPAGMMEFQKSRFQKLYHDGLEWQSRGRIDSARICFEASISLDSAYADAHYRLAQCLEALHKMPQALQEYRRARDYDELRFRTDSRFNNLILSMQNEPQCAVVDVERCFMSFSPDSLIGHNLISEHLHPHAHGQFIMAAEYSRMLQRLGLVVPAEKSDPNNAPSDSLLWLHRHLTPVDEYMAARKIELLTSRWPFRSQPGPVTVIGETDTLRFIADQAVHNRMGWITMHERAAEFYLRRADAPSAAREYETILSQLPKYVYAYLNLAKIHYDLGDFSTAEKLLLASLQVETTPVACRVLGDICLKQRRADAAIQYYEALLKFPEDARTAPDNLYMLALAYLVGEKPDSALPILERTVQRFPAYRPARDLLARTKMVRGPTENPLTKR